MGKKNTILFVHQNFPGQYKHLAPALNQRDDFEVYSLSLSKISLPKIKHYTYQLNKKGSDTIHKLAAEFESKMIRGEAAAKKCSELKKNGLNPDIIISHPGWGETLFIKEIWPKTKLLNYFEFYYNTRKSDIDFDVGEKLCSLNDFDLSSKLIARNQPLLMSYLQSDILVSPTHFQANTAPDIFKDRISVVHDGINTKTLIRNKNTFITVTKDRDLSNEVIKLTNKDKIVTFVNRNLEPYRGYHIFMRALPDILEKHPDAYILIVGGSGVSYGATPPNGQNYKDIYFNEVKDLLKDRRQQIKFLGKVAYKSLLRMFAVSTVHVYFTYPFVLSWSMLEAMSLEALIVGSSTDPVKEVIQHNKNGLLTDFHDHKSLAKVVNDVLSGPGDYNKIRKNARKTIVDNYDLQEVCLPKQMELVENLL